MNNVKKSIGWADFTLNPVKGLCPNSDCPLFPDRCYARRMYKRFKWEPGLRFYPIKDDDLPKKPSRIFVGSTMELFGEWVDAFWMDSIFKSVKDNPQHTFIFLTKRPLDFLRFNPFPPNSWIGSSVCNPSMLRKALIELSPIQASVKFLSFEPLLKKIEFHAPYNLDFSEIQWVICGQLTPVSKKTQPKLEWIKEIVDAADKSSIPVFIKNNMRSLFETPAGILRGKWWVIKDNELVLRQEFPNDHT